MKSYTIPMETVYILYTHTRNWPNFVNSLKKYITQKDSDLTLLLSTAARATPGFEKLATIDSGNRTIYNLVL